MIKKQRLYKQYLRNKSNSSKRKYAAYRNVLTNLIRQAKKAHFARILEKSRFNLKKTWTILNDLLGKRPSNLPSHFHHNSEKLLGHSKIANAFNSYFVNSGSFIQSDNTPGFQNYLGPRCKQSFFISPTNPTELIQITKQLKLSHSAGHDGFSSFQLKKIIHFIAEPLSKIFNLSLITGIFPETMKTSKVIPVLKKGDPHLITNYRPISLLSTFSKILERLVYKRLSDFLDKNNIIISQQFGFRKYHSTETALLYATELLYSFFEKNEYAVGIYIDLSKAFDCLSHDVLLYKLNHYGVRGVPLQWFSSYLSSRCQYTTYCDVNSQILRIKQGVPQGSILGPLLFLLFINDIINSSNVLKFLLYADDTNLFLSNSNLDTLMAQANYEMLSVCNWFHENGLQINTSKTKYMVFDYQRVKRVLETPQLQIDRIIVEKVESINFLGVVVDNELSWIKHIDYVCKKTSMYIGMLFKLRSFLPLKSLKMLYKSVILPHFTYCNLVWGSASNSHLRRLLILQKKAIRICFNMHFRAHTAPLFKSMQLLNILDNVSFNVVLFMHKFVHQRLPKVFNAFFKKHSDVHGLNTRGKDKFYLPKLNSSFLQRSIKYQGVVEWNKLNSDLQNINNCTIFKRIFKLQLFTNY